MARKDQCCFGFTAAGLSTVTQSNRTDTTARTSRVSATWSFAPSITGLGPLGFCNLAGVGGEKFAASGNVGMLDIVAALEWVRDNIANFGGDPGNVTIMGQSGGGAKVCILTAMPSAKGLFHKAVVLSGASSKAGDKTHSENFGAAVLKEVGLRPDELAKLQAMPWSDFYAIATRAQQNMAKKAGPGGGMTRGFVPVVDGDILPQHPYDPVAAPTAADVPMIISSVQNEQSPSWADPSLESITLDQVVERVQRKEQGSAQASEIKRRKWSSLMRRPFLAGSRLKSGPWSAAIGESVVALADVKSKQPAPVYVELVHLAASFVRQPPAGVSLRRYLLLVLQHGSHADSHGRRSKAKSPLDQNVQGLIAIHENR